MNKFFENKKSKMIIVLTTLCMSISFFTSEKAYAEPSKEVTKYAFYDFNRFTGSTSGLYGGYWIWVPASSYVTDIIDNQVSQSVSKIVYRRNYYFSKY